MKTKQLLTQLTLSYLLLGGFTLAKPADEALYHANDLASLKKQIKAGGDANACYSDAGTTALMRITYAGLKPDVVAAMIRELIRAGAKVNAQSQYKKGFPGSTEPEGMTALMHACEAYYEGDDFIMGGGAHPQVVKALLDAGANPNLKNAQGTTALEYALFSGSAESVRLLLAAGARATEKPREAGNYLMLISSFPHAQRSIPMIPLLLEAGLDINARDTQGQSALHYSCRQPDTADDSYLWEQRTRFAAALLKAGARLDLKDHSGRSPLDHAQQSLPHSQQLVTLLQAASTP